jgi:hypothetical protein
MMATDPATFIRHSLGRFDFALPESLISVGQTTYPYTLKAWSKCSPHKMAESQMWAEGQAWVASGSDVGVRPGIVSEQRLAGVGPSLWYRPYPDEHPKRMALLVMRAVDDCYLFLRANGAEERKTVVETVVSRIAATYAAHSGQGFALEHGALVIRPSNNERAYATYSGGGFEISVSTETVDEPIDKDRAPGPPSEVRLLEMRPRIVAGLAGLERHYSLSAAGDARLAYAWTFPGKPVDALAPRIVLKAMFTADGEAVMRGAWLGFLDSLALRPTPMGRV